MSGILTSPFVSRIPAIRWALFISFRQSIEVVVCITKEMYFLNVRRPDVAEVCMDAGAVSSNALVSILLDGGVVKDWCKRTFHSISLGLRDICIHPFLFYISSVLNMTSSWLLVL